MGAIDERVIRASLGAWHAKAPAVSTILRVAGVQSDCLEASVRYRGGRYSGDRMMLEGLDSLTALAILTGLGFELQGSLIVRAAALARGLVVIGGWDASGDELVGKFYINASDASLARRQQIAGALDLPRQAGAPHVIGFNVRQSDTEEALETKVYDQRGSVDDEVPPFIVHLLGDATPAGLVRSRVVVDVDELSTKAWFVAPRASDAADMVRRLEGFDAKSTYACLPFAPGAIKSVGGPDATSWTIYFKPKGMSESPYALEPAACFSMTAPTACEVGLYITPAEQTLHAYCRTTHHALSYRVREGDPGPEIDALMAWSQQHVRACEQTSRDPSTIDFSAPPQPWAFMNPSRTMDPNRESEHS